LSPIIQLRTIQRPLKFDKTVNGKVIKQKWSHNAATALNEHVWFVSFEVLTVVRMMMFWVLMPCILIGRYQHFVKISSSGLKSAPEDGDRMFL
jgi:hypothetical protein